MVSWVLRSYKCISLLSGWNVISLQVFFRIFQTLHITLQRNITTLKPTFMGCLNWTFIQFSWPPITTYPGLFTFWQDSILFGALKHGKLHRMWCLLSGITFLFLLPPASYSFRGMFSVTGLLSKLNEKLFFEMKFFLFSFVHVQTKFFCLVCISVLRNRGQTESHVQLDVVFLVCLSS